jgi:hypothetical protein
MILRKLLLQIEQVSLWVKIIWRCGIFASMNICYGRVIKMTSFVHFFNLFMKGLENELAMPIILVYVGDITILTLMKSFQKPDCLNKEFVDCDGRLEK